MNEIFFIENTIDEWNTSIKGYFPTFEEAKEKLAECCDWYCAKGTGKIYKVKFGLNARPELVYSNPEFNLEDC